MIQLSLDPVINKIKQVSPKTVVLQIPEGMKDQIISLIEELQSIFPETVFVTLMDPCFGACDLGDDKAKLLQADLLIHFGHTRIYEPQIETLFVPIKYDVDFKIVDKMEELFKDKKFEKIGLCSATQYTESLPKVKELLEKKEFKTFFDDGSYRVTEPGQILGCNYTSTLNFEKKVDCIIYFGDGYFHSLGLCYATKKPVFFVNPRSMEIIDLKEHRENYLKKRFAAITVARDAKKFGIIISTKKGQYQKNLAKQTQKMLKENQKETIIFAVDYVNPDYFIGVQVDAFVCCGCPRIAIDDYSMWKKPILNPKEVEILVGKRKLEDYEFDQIL